jgi:hypothetical protein
MKFSDFRIDSYGTYIQFTKIDVIKASGNKYILYNCLCTINGVENVLIEKRYSEFLSLSQDISKFKYSSKIPEFPPKLVINNFQIEKIKQRKESLDKYMKEVTKIEEFKVYFFII